MKDPRNLLTGIARRLQLPTDVAAGLPRLELNGFGECSLDCHTGILEYREDEIVVALNIGTVTIRGSRLQLQQMHRERLTVTGSIDSITFSGDKS